MGHGVGVPAFGQHGNADHAPDVLAELARLAHSVHDLAQEVFIRQICSVTPRKPHTIFGLEFLDFRRGNLFEIRAHGLAGFKLLAVHKDRIRPLEPPAVAVVVAKDGKLPSLDDRPVANGLFPATNVIKNQLRHIGVVAHNDEHRRRQPFGPGLFVLFPQAIILFVIAVEAVQRPLQFRRKLGLPAHRIRLPALHGKMLPDALPQIAVGRLVTDHGIVGHGHARHFDHTRLDGVDERKIGDNPREKRPFRKPGTTKKKRRGG